nr:hypothetical protein [Lachnospiraceae bacterium]
MDEKYKLADDLLEGIAGGTMDVNDDPQKNGRCQECSSYLTKTFYGYFCKSCGLQYDNNHKVIGKEDLGSDLGRISS